MNTRAGRSGVVPRSGTAAYERQTQRRRTHRKRIKTIAAVVFLIFETIIATVLCMGAVLFYRFAEQVPSLNDVQLEASATVPTTIWSQDGVMLGKLQSENRQPIAFDQMPLAIRNATVAIEDHRFFEHRGIDPQGIARATWTNIREKNYRGQGASTLTQQLVRNLGQFGLSRDKVLARKIREALLAMRLEQMYTKKEILRLYLNTVYYGNGAYGVEAASKTYFNKPTSKLTLAEAAMLAGLPQRPTESNPIDDLEASVRRRGEVLKAMLDNGLVTQAQYAAARDEKPRIKRHIERRSVNFKAPYFVTYVIGTVARRYGRDMLYSGLRIDTTLNWKMQQAAEHSLYKGLQNGSGRGANQGALVSIDNKTGHIRAMVGGRNFHADQFNAITQGLRQPGSTFKVFDYSAAFDMGKCDLHTTFRDYPVPYRGDREGRKVKNYDGRYSYREIDCLTAIKFSKNTIAVQVADEAKITNVIKYARKMGIKSALAPYLPTALGASAVRPLDLCSAYSQFANDGTRYIPQPIVRIQDGEGRIIEEPPLEARAPVLKSSTVQQIQTALMAVVESGTGAAARGTSESGIVENAHGKTGTTSDNRDAWFAGYTPELCTVVWVASVHRKRGGNATYAEMPGATGGHLCAPIWHDFMVRAIPEQRKIKLPASRPIMSRAPEAEAVEPIRIGRPRRHPKRVVQIPVAKPPDSVMTAAAEPAANIDDQSGSAPVVPTAADSPPISRPGPRAVRTTPAPEEADRSIAVDICVDSGQRAGPWCEVRKTVRMSAGRASALGRCRVHRPPPGEE